MMIGDHYAVIMAGGGGTRLWPASRRKRAKQSLRLFGDKTPFQWAVERLLPIIPPEQIYVATVVWQVEQLWKQASMLPEENFIHEPAPRGTASVAGLAALTLRRRNPEAVIACLPADHFIADVDRFQALLLAAFEVAIAGNLVTLGISPTFAAECYGYIHQGEKIGEYRGIDAYQVEKFVEKPTRAVAEGYLASGEYLWNSGMFIWKAARYLEEIERWMPKLHASLETIDPLLGNPKQKDELDRVYKGLESETIDYGIMEKAEHVAVLPALDLGWCDIGGWDRLFAIVGADEHGNVVLAPETLMVDTTETLVFQDPSARRLIATLGADDLIIIDSGDVLLVCPKERAEGVRHLVELLRSEGKNQYL